MEVPKSQKKAKRTSKFRQVYVKLIFVRKQNVSKPVTLNESKFSSLPYNKHVINRAKSVCMGESWPRSCVQTSLHSVSTHDLGQDSPIQTDLARLIRAKYKSWWDGHIIWYGYCQAGLERSPEINNMWCLQSYLKRHFDDSLERNRSDELNVLFLGTSATRVTRVRVKNTRTWCWK